MESIWGAPAAAAIASATEAAGGGRSTPFDGDVRWVRASLLLTAVIIPIQSDNKNDFHSPGMNGEKWMIEIFNE